MSRMLAKFTTTAMPDFVEVVEETKFYILAAGDMNTGDLLPLYYDTANKVITESPDEFCRMIVFTQEKLAKVFYAESWMPFSQVMIIPRIVESGEVMISDFYRAIPRCESKVSFIDINDEALWKKKVFGDEPFTIHCVLNTLSEEERFEQSLQNYNDIHTHGCNLYDHMEFQMVYNTDLHDSKEFLSSLYNLVKMGVRFKPGDKIGQNFSLFQMKDNTTGEYVLRIICADPSGKFPWDAGCDEAYKLQVEDRW